MIDPERHWTAARQPLLVSSHLRGAPRAIQVGNRPEFSSKALDSWAYEISVTLDSSRPGRPTDYALVEPSNSRMRDECLIANWFLLLADARDKIETRRQQYNESRPYTALGRPTPEVFVLATAQQAVDWGRRLTSRPNQDSETITCPAFLPPLFGQIYASVVFFPNGTSVARSVLEFQ